MMVINGPVRIAGDVVSGLREHPFALAIVVINVLFIISATWMLYSISKAVERRDAMISDCILQQGK